MVDTNKCYQSGLIIDSQKFNKVVKKLREFFWSKNFLEVHTQNRLSILAACEDPFNVQTFNYTGKVWPLVQTGQMWLEYEILSKPDVAGYFCLTTSYRMEPNPVPGRHDVIFPMFEFEFKGNMQELMELQKELLVHLGYDSSNFYVNSYKAIAEEFGTVELEHEHEEKLYTDKSPVAFITDFPEFTSPFWNMRRNPNDDTSYKVDVILHGVETIGSAQRSTDVNEMKHMFYNISEGQYANILFSNFTKERVEKELNEFLEFEFFDRCGGGIGMTRLIRAMKLSNLLN